MKATAVVANVQGGEGAAREERLTDEILTARARSSESELRSGNPR